MTMYSYSYTTMHTYDKANQLVSSTTNGKGYSYTAPNVGDGDSVTPSQPPNGIKPVADIHAHAAYASGYNNDIFSSADMKYNDIRGITGYLTTPNGSLQKYDPTQPQGKRNSTISDQMPYDPKHPNPLKPKKQE